VELFGPADPDVVLDEELNEAPGSARFVEDPGVRDLHLAHGELREVAGRSVFIGERRGDDVRPTVEESLDVGNLTKRIETITALLDEAIGALEAPADEAPTAALDSGTGEILTAPLAYLSAIERISEIPGGGPETAREVIGEIGLDMAIFSTPQRLCSWAKCSPGTVQSGTKTKGAPTGKGNPYLKAALGQMATGAARTDTFLGERYSGVRVVRGQARRGC